MSTATPATHAVTLALTGLGASARAYTSPVGWSSADGWTLTVPANGTVSPVADGLLVQSNAATVLVR